NMGLPNFEPASLPFRYPDKQLGYELLIDNELVYFGAVSMGNPHIIIPVTNLNTTPVQKLGQMLSEHPAFPEQVNVGFMQQISRNRLKLRVYERGVGETEACGSGACAAVVIGRSWDLFDANVEVMVPGGELSILWDTMVDSVLMTGPAEFIFDGAIIL
ncbi:MAG: diaminopimelate epimerase, partial [Alphaproteobacteria bacterium]|nr:diaminopimelate epimerase [Alphaproteobacteria bacterium]